LVTVIFLTKGGGFIQFGRIYRLGVLDIKMDSGQWSNKSGQWSVDSGQKDANDNLILIFAFHCSGR
jgi:hypothetical protein